MDIGTSPQNPPNTWDNSA